MNTLFNFDDTFNLLAGNMMNEFNNIMAEYEVNKTRPGIATLTFTPVPAEKANGLGKAKTGFFGLNLFGGGARKKFIEGIENGKASCAEVLAIARTDRIVDRSEKVPENNVYKIYYKVADLNGHVIREDVPAIDDDYAFELINYAGDTNSADVVDPENYQHMYIFKYYLKDEPFYVLLTKEQLDDLSLLADHAGEYWHSAEDGVGYKW